MSIGENVSEEMMRAAEQHAQQKLAELDEQNAKKRKTLIRVGTMMLFTVLLLIAVVVAWMSMK